MINKIKDEKFLLVTVPAAETYQVLFMVIPKIQQIQLVARQGKWENVHFNKDKWEVCYRDYRTTIEALPKKWTVEITIEEITLDQVKVFCPEVCNIVYSTDMQEDLVIKKATAYKS